VTVANCTQCGKGLPALTFGELQTLCEECRAKAPYESAEPAEPELETPPLKSAATASLMAISIAVWIAMVVSGVSPLAPESTDIVRWGGDHGPLALGSEPWRLLTSAFVHVGIIHLVLNMWCLWQLGRMAEGIFGRAGLLAIYAQTAVSASLLAVWWGPLRTGAGASGAIFGIAGAVISALYVGNLPVPREHAKKTLQSLVAFAAYNLMIGLAGNISNMAHLGGLLGGLAIGAALAHSLPFHSAPVDQYAIPGKDDAGERYRNRQKFVFTMAAVVLAVAYFGVRQVRAYAPHLLQLQEAYDKGDYAAAIAEAEVVLQHEPDEAYTLALLGSALERTGEVARAEAAYIKSIQASPQYPYPAVRLAGIRIDKGKPAEARAILDRLFRSDAPEDEYAQLYYGLALDGEGSHQVAHRYFDRAVELAPRNAGILESVAQSHLSHDEPDLALQLAEQALAIDPQRMVAAEIVEEAKAAKGKEEQKRRKSRGR
jgi:rhomboid protease GluP